MNISDINRIEIYNKLTSLLTITPKISTRKNRHKMRGGKITKNSVIHTYNEVELINNGSGVYFEEDKYIQRPKCGGGIKYKAIII